MSQPKRNLWGDVDQEPASGPNPVLALLEEQAAVLAEMTAGRITGEVVPLSHGELPMRWEFKLVAPMADFRYALFEVAQQALHFPVEIWLYGAKERKWMCADQTAFEDALAAVLRSDETRKALASIRALDKIQGRRSFNLTFTDDKGESCDGAVLLEPLPRVLDGTEYRATVTTVGGVILQARVMVSGTAEATLSEEEITQRIATEIRSLLQQRPSIRLDTSFPTIMIGSRETSTHLR
jgi:hypothetical protein